MVLLDISIVDRSKWFYLDVQFLGPSLLQLLQWTHLDISFGVFHNINLFLFYIGGELLGSNVSISISGWLD